jgi:hypothetical protein
VATNRHCFANNQTLLDLNSLYSAVRSECIRLNREETDAHSGAGEPWLRLYELCCACEQVLSDLCLVLSDTLQSKAYRLSRNWSRSAATIAMSAFLGAGELSRGILENVERDALTESQFWTDEVVLFPIQDRTQTYAKLPECFTRDMIDLACYSRWIMRRIKSLAPSGAVVIGIRTSGSYLVPIWDAALKALGISKVTLTARPNHRPRSDSGDVCSKSKADQFKPFEEETSLIRSILFDNGAEKTFAFIVDDLAFTGVSFLRIEEYLLRLGLKRRHVVFCPNSPVLPSSLTRQARATLVKSKVWVGSTGRSESSNLNEAGSRYLESILHEGCPDDIRIDKIEPAQPTYMQKYLAAHFKPPITQLVHMNARAVDQRYRVEATVCGSQIHLYAKIIGMGYLVQHDLGRIRQFERTGGYRIFAFAKGYLFYEWVPGSALQLCDNALTSAELDQIAEYASSIAKWNRIGNVDRHEYVRNVVLRLQSTIGDMKQYKEPIRKVAARFVASSGLQVPMVDAPRNQSHWHYIRTCNGLLKRVHLELGEWSWKMDPAEEIASASIELGLSDSQSEKVRHGFAVTTGDRDSINRLKVAALSYISRVLGNYKYWDDRIAQIPEMYRKDRHEESVLTAALRKKRMLAVLDEILGITPGR